MPHDKNGVVIKKGARVNIPCVVLEVGGSDRDCNVVLETEEVMPPHTRRTTITINTKQTVQFAEAPPEPVAEPKEPARPAAKTSTVAKAAAILVALFALAFAFPAKAQDTNPPPSVESSLGDLWTAIRLDHTNWIWEAHGLYAPALQSKYGGGLGAFHPITKYMFTGLRVDYVNGGFWMPSGSAGLQLPITPFSWLHLTPFTYAGIGIPLSGAKVGDFSVPGHVRDNNGQATAILGYGVAVKLYTSKSGRWSVDLVADRENWSGFSGQQYRGGVLLHKSF